MQNAVNDRPCILIEGPRRGDVEFYGRWLLAAAEAQRLFTEASKDQVFNDEILVLQAYCLVDLGIMASDMLQKLFEHELTAIIAVGGTDESGDYPIVLEAFTTLSALGFFTVTGERYQMVIPPKLDVETVKRTLIKRAADVDALIAADAGENLTTMPRAAANRWRKLRIIMATRGWQLIECQRVADRNALLE
jgi:hypothetical protein